MTFWANWKLGTGNWKLETGSPNALCFHILRGRVLEIDVKRSLFGRNFVLASLAYFFVFLSAAMFYLFPLFLVDRFHASKSRVGIIMGVHSVASIMIRPLFGRIMDKRGGRTVTIAGLLLMIAVIPGFYLVESAGIWTVLLRALNGIGWGIATTAILAICSEMSPPERMARSLGIIGAAGIVPGAIGPALAEEIMRRYNFNAVFTAALIALVTAFFCMIAVNETPPGKSPTKVERTTHYSTYPLLILLIVAAMPIGHGAARGAVLNFIAPFGASAGFGRVGLFFAAFSAAAIITRLGLGDLSDQYGRKRVILPTAILIGINLFWIAGVHSYWGFVLCGFVSGLGQGFMFPALSTYVMDFLGRENKGLALGLYLSLYDIGMGLGSPVFGWISDMSGYRQMYVVAGCLIILLSLVFHIKAPPDPAPQMAASEIDVKWH
jgi:MFS family permease